IPQRRLLVPEYQASRIEELMPVTSLAGGVPATNAIKPGHLRAMNQIDLLGKTAIVTGSARGIGFAIARRMLSSGAKVSLWDNDATALKNAARLLNDPGRTQTVVVDITQEAQVTSAMQTTSEHFPGIDILVNNAGIAGVSKKLWECTPAEWRQV